MATRALEADTAPDELLRAAHEAAYRLPPGFGGFTADVTCVAPGALALGSLRVASDGRSELALGGVAEDDDLHRAAQRDLASMVAHRWASRYEDGDGRYAKHLGEGDADGDGDELDGCLVTLEGDPFASSYRVAGGQVVQVNRTMGPVRFSIVICARTAAPDGRLLPAQFTVHHWDAETGRLTRSESVSDTYATVGDVVLPATRRVVTATDAGLQRRELRLTGHRLLDTAARP